MKLVNLLDTFFSSHPGMLGAAVFLGVLTGTGTTGAYFNSFVASTSYVDTVVAERILEVKRELYSTLDYKFALNTKRDLESEIFELKMLQRNSPEKFSDLHARRLNEKEIELNDLLRAITNFENQSRVTPSGT